MAYKKSSPLAEVENASEKSKRRRGIRKGSSSPYMTVAEAEEYTGVSRWTLWRMDKTTRIRVGKNWVFKENREGILTVKWIAGCKFYLKTEIHALGDLS
jgi:hypothetical protein